MVRAYPVHLSLAETPVLCVGAGSVARRRLLRLLGAGARVQVVAPEAADAVQDWARAGRLRWARRPFEEADLEGARLVFVATPDRALNAAVARGARSRGAWVNRADAPEDCDFTVPALAESESCLVSVGTEGRAPGASRRLARELTGWLRDGPERFVAAVAEARRELAGRADARAARARLSALAGGPLWDACRRGDEPAVRAALDAALQGGAGRG